ncbi:protein ACCELERATED CELL DEATH 6 [Cocos nucifera]|uniref:Protein ACCELERATED CELL DEATH 6 n=1 Tax=Cocos nucifera TaxID=13894 RepID=A0A8K0NCW3_COCNU|nr:protein ACCELERATED CELL DEATH 6 [Cocos nucifera]
MAEAKATPFGIPADTLPEEESMTAEIVQTYSDLEVPARKIQPQRIAINPKLLEAARSGHTDILDELLRPKDTASGASVEEFTIIVPEESAIQKDASCLLGVTPDGNTTLHVIASRGHLELAKEIYYRESSLLVAQNTKLDTPLHCAARAGDDEMVSLIIRFAKEDKIEAKVLTAVNKDDANALHEAAKYDHVRVANILIKEDAELASKPNCDGMSPLYLAIMMGSLNVAKALLQFFSSWKKASLQSYAGPSKHTALHAAVSISQASNGHRDTVKLLLEHNSSTAYQPDADGFFPIHIATVTGNIGVVDQILKQCPDADELSDQEGRNFLHVAFQRSRLDLIKKIISKRSDLRKLLNDQDDMGNTPLHTAVKTGNQETVYFLLQDKTVHLNIANNEGLTPLNMAFSKRDKGMYFETALFGVPQNLLAFKGVVSSSDRDKTKPSSVNEVKEKSPSDEGNEKPSIDDKLKENSSSAEEKELKPSIDDKVKENSSSIDGKIKKNSSGVKEKESKKWPMPDEELKKQLDVPKNLTIVTVLIATVTFTAGVAVPGGYMDDDHAGHGTSVLAKEYAFKVFQVSDVFAFVCSIAATFWLMNAGTSALQEY